MPHLLSKSDFKHARGCVTKLFYKKKGYPSILDEDTYLELLAEGGYMIEEIARNVYPDGIAIDYSGGREEAVRKTQAALEAGQETLFEATFISDGKLVRVDIFNQTGDTIQLIEVKAKSWDSDEERSRDGADKKRVTWSRNGISSDWEDYIADVTYQTMVLREVFPGKTITPYLFMPDKAKTTSIDLLHKHFRLNKHVNQSTGFTSYDVVFTGDVEALRANHFLTLVDVSEEVEYMMPSVAREAEALLATLRPSFHRHQAPLTPECKKCEYRIDSDHDSENVSERISEHDLEPSGFMECWGRLGAHKPHIFDLYFGTTLQRGGDNLFQQLIDCGQTSLVEMDDADCCNAKGSVGKRNERQLIQLRCSRAGEEYQDERLARELSALPYPLHFIDFETSKMAVPYHAGMRPYENVAFQWSCHTVDSAGATPRHAEWINTEDAFPNFEFARSLYEHIGSDGSVLIWSHHENTILRDIRRQFLQKMQERGFEDSELLSWLDDIVRDETSEGRLVDMYKLCVDYYFHPLMGGRTGIKYVLAAVWASSAAVREAFPEYVGYGEDGELLSPYSTLEGFEFDGRSLSVKDGTEAMTAYQAMLYGMESRSAEQREAIRDLLLRYCKLDTAAMVMIWGYWKSGAKQ